MKSLLVALLCCVATASLRAAPASESPAGDLRPAQRLRINGPSVFGVRPGHPVLYRVPATGERPLQFSASGLPEGVQIDESTGLITGRVARPGDYPITLKVRNRTGVTERKFTLKVGEQICLTPPMGWNSWNCWAESVSTEKVLQSARAMIASGLADHGWTYINIDDGWQGKRDGEGHALNGNEKFPDMRRLCDEVHALGLKIGLYSTPWVTSYANYPGGSADTADGAWTRSDNKEAGRRHGAYTFEAADARQWARWGVDYLKYDWFPNDVPHAKAMFEALRRSGRDIVLSLSNAAAHSLAHEWPKVANAWRTTGDIGDAWSYDQPDAETWRYSVSEIAFSQDPWATAAGPGHWNDPDMLVVGKVGWGPSLHPTNLTRDEQVTHLSMWCMLSAPLLIGCPLEELDAFTTSLLSNDDVLAINQDALGKPAVRVATLGAIDVYRKPLEDGSYALGFFNRGDRSTNFTFSKLERVGFPGTWHARDLWKQKDLPDVTDRLSGDVPAHGVLLLRLWK